MHGYKHTWFIYFLYKSALENQCENNVEKLGKVWKGLEKHDKTNSDTTDSHPYTTLPEVNLNYYTL